MEAAPLKEIRAEIKRLSEKELQDIILRLGRFKKENKELLTYVLFEEADERSFVMQIKEQMDADFDEVDSVHYYVKKKRIRKILSRLKKVIRYSSSKETEVDLLLYFCKKMLSHLPNLNRYPMLERMYIRQRDMGMRKLEKLHEDLQYDYLREFEALEEDRPAPF